MNGKVGRPKVEKPKNIRYSVRLDVEIEEKLKKYCKNNGITKGEAIRQGLDLLLGNKKG